MGFRVLNKPGHECELPDWAAHGFGEGTVIECTDIVRRNGDDVRCGISYRLRDKWGATQWEEIKNLGW